MLELVRILIEALSRLAPQALAADSKMTRVELGRRLMAVYVCTNQVIVEGEEILWLLQDFLDNGAVDADHERQKRLEWALAHQRLALEELLEAASALAYPLQVLDGSAFATVMVIAGAKHSMLRAAITLQQSGRLLVLEPSDAGRATPQRPSIPSPEELLFEYGQRSLVGLNDPAQLLDYVRGGAGERALDNLRAGAETLRLRLLQSYSLEDVLPPPRDDTDPRITTRMRRLGIGGRSWRWR